MGPADNFEEEVNLLGFDPWAVDPKETRMVTAGMLASILVLLYTKGEVQGEKNAFIHASMIASDAARRRREMVSLN